MSRQHREQGKRPVQYRIEFPNSLKQKQDIISDVYARFFDELQDKNINIIVKENTKYYYFECEVDDSDRYYFLSKLNLLKMKYIEYGMYFYEKKQK
jgi:hypothetical protein